MPQTLSAIKTEQEMGVMINCKNLVKEGKQREDKSKRLEINPHSGILSKHQSWDCVRPDQSKGSPETETVTKTEPQEPQLCE